MTSNSHAAHTAAHDHAADCPACLAKPGATRSAKLAWTVAAIALVLLAAVLVFRPGTPTWALAGGGGLLLLALLLCPVVMGATMFFMMRGGH